MTSESNNKLQMILKQINQRVLILITKFIKYIIVNFYG